MCYLWERNIPSLRPAIAAVLVLCLTVQQTESSAVGWNYNVGQSGEPKQWYINYPDCGGVCQSPICIKTKRALYDVYLKKFNTSDYSITDGVGMRLENMGGHTAELILSGPSLFLRGGSLPDIYKLIQIHFHWGQNNRRGSEHCINGKYYPMEMHMVHTQRRFASVADASPKPFGLAVLAFFFEVGEFNPNFDKLVSNLRNISNANDEVEIETFPVSDLIPATFDFYRYDGSLTTPPCSESVIWSVGVPTIKISQEQLNAFRALYDEERHRLVNDFRPVQPLNKRAVRTTKKPKAK
ncbi:hypothetical protein BsWGS_08496 [Bradybaena similaris]